VLRPLLRRLSVGPSDLGARSDDVTEPRTDLVGRESLGAWLKARAAVCGHIYPNGKWPPSPLVIVPALNRAELRVEILVTVALPG